jgi:nucleotide-binding universal stress UspA family protein
MFHSILVAVDGSRSAAKALEKAIELARSEGARLTLIAVAAPLRLPIATGTYVAPLPGEDDLVRQAERTVERAEALVPEDIPVSTVVRRGPVAKAIVERIEAGEHDLVIMGSHGRGPVRSLVLGSVSNAVLARSPVPVLIVRGSSAPEPDEPCRDESRVTSTVPSREPAGAGPR